MLKAERTITVAKPQVEVWEFVADMSNWAQQMPGYISHDVVNENMSVWTVHVNLGPFQRPVVIDVEVTEWLPPSDVFFKIKGRVEPFQGGGQFHTDPAGSNTEINLRFEAEPTGPMAALLGGLARPVLDRVANEFSANLASALGPKRPLENGRDKVRVPANSASLTWWKRALNWCRSIAG